MPNRIYSVEDITLQGWTDENGEPKPIRIHPLTIKALRAIFEIFDFEDEKNKDKTFMDICMEAAAMAMKTFEPQLSNIKKLEQYIDQPTLYHLLKIAAGIEFDDKNLATTMSNLDGKAF